MLEITSWLKSVEEAARILYFEGVEYFANNKKLVWLLDRLAIDESYHYTVVTMIEEIIRNENIDLKQGIRIDEPLKRRILTPFQVNLEKMRSKTLSESELYDSLVTSEFSEWNDIFLYVLGSVSEGRPELQKAASKMQKHLNGLEQFFLSDSSLKTHYEELRRLPKVWAFKILVVNDQAIIRNLLQEVLLKKYGTVDVAIDGVEAEAKCELGYYDAVVTDVDLPRMGGIELYKQLLDNPAFDPNTFIFISGGLEPQFVRDRGLRFVPKPFLLETVVTAVEEIVNRVPV
jgi:CheY-like chemotaxis protein